MASSVLRIRTMVLCCVGIVILTLELQGQPCHPCAGKWTRRIMLYDCHVKVPKPSDPSLMSQWFQLFYASGGIASQMMNGDPSTPRCVIVLAGALFPTGDQPTDVLRVGIEHMNLPPSGAVRAGDYVLWGSVEQSGSGYRLDVLLESAITRERVASGSTTFASATDAMDRAAQVYAQAISPISATIYQWEQQKRANNPIIAIGVLEEGFTISPAKREVSPGEEIDVEIRLVDCDGVPLAGRTLLLTQSQFSGSRLPGSENGTFTSATAVTDNNGRARVRFVAGMNQGPAVLRAYFVYKNPPGRDMAVGASEIITVGRADLWEIRAAYRFEEELVQDTAWTAFGGSFTYHREMSLAGSATMRGLLRASYDQGNLYLEDLVSVSVAGVWLRRGFTNNKMTSDRVGLVSAGISITNDEGIALPEDEYGNPSELSFYDEGGNSMVINVAPLFSTLRYYFERDFSPSLEGWITREGEGVETSSFPAEYHHGRNGTIVRSANQYTASFSTVDSAFTPDVVNGTAKTVTRTSLSAVIRPYSPVTDVEKHDEQGVPARYQLFQNYPNPFNPQTVISYDVPVASHVTLNVYDLLGREVKRLVDEIQMPGAYAVSFFAEDLPSGVYIYRLHAGAFVAARKLILIR